jgi:hypothetical protein
MGLAPTRLCHDLRHWPLLFVAAADSPSIANFYQ